MADSYYDSDITKAGAVKYSTGYIGFEFKVHDRYLAVNDFVFYDLCEDEWGEMKDRFKKEGLDFETLKLEDRILQVWRWLVDAESNLRNSRRMLDKLYEKQHEEIEEMENYLCKMRKLAEQRTDDLENERIHLFHEKEELEHLLNSENIIGENLLDRVTKLLEERNKVVSDLATLKAFKIPPDSNVNNTDSEMLSEIIKVSFEKESLKREVAVLTDRIILLEKSSRQFEIDNERLSFKLSEALAEIEEKETQLGLSERPSTWINDAKCHLSGELSRCSKDLYDTESKDISPKDAHSNSYHKEPSQSYGADSTPPSLLMSELASFGSPKKLSSLLESCNELAWVEEVKNLQAIIDDLRTQLTILGEKYNSLALKHIQYKTKRKFQIDKIRERLEACECQVETLQYQLSIHRQRLRAEEIFRKQIETDYRRLQDEKRTLSARLLNAETHQREDSREFSILQRKVALLDTANSELVAQLMKLKYKSNMTKSTTCDDMLATL